MTMANPPESTIWHITGQTETTQIAPGGEPVSGVTVYYTTGKGNSGSVFVAGSQYTTDNVRARIAAAAANMDAISQLTSETPQ